MSGFFDYVIVSPVKDEERYLPLTLRSVTSQTVLPRRWIIVSDGSTDATARIARKWAVRHPWITVVEKENEGGRRRGGGVVRAFHKGFFELIDEPWEFVVKLDGDLSFEPRFFERIFKEFARRPRLGISSGISYAWTGTGWMEEKASRGYTYGETKVYRRRCFEEIGGLVEHMGWDGIDHVKAIQLGWEAEQTPGVVFYHHRRQGQATGLLRAELEEGLCSYFMGYHPLFLLARGIRHMKCYPYGIGGLALIASYGWHWLKQTPRYQDQEFTRFLRRNQLRKLLLQKTDFF
ncbi:MAG: glycosyltransferase family A protein [Pseudomonadota bacterium]